MNFAVDANITAALYYKRNGDIDFEIENIKDVEIVLSVLRQPDEIFSGDKSIDSWMYEKTSKTITLKLEAGKSRIRINTTDNI